MGEVNFSERTKRPVDPHDWHSDNAQLTYQGDVIDTITIWVCLRCVKWTILPPHLICSEDLGECKIKELSDDQQ